MARLFEQTIDNNPNDADRLAFERSGQTTRNITFLNFLAYLRGVFTASETDVGGAEIATQTETNTGTDDTRMVTPLKLANRTANETRAGVLEIATQAETTTGTDNTRAVTPLKLQQKIDSIGLTIQTTIIDIGDWDMDTNAVPAVTPTHGLTLSNIRSVEAYIRADVGASLSGAVYPIWTAVTGSANDSGGSVNAQTTNIGLSRRASGFFDSTDFNDTSYNRGWIIIKHV